MPRFVEVRQQGRPKPRKDLSLGGYNPFIISKLLFDANSILKADAVNLPEALTITEQTLVGRKTGGTISALSGADALLAMGISSTVAELNILDGCTALYSELNLLDLTGLTAGQLLVATGATSAAWQSTGVKLSAPDISGVVTAASTLTFPAFTLGGAITGGGQVLNSLGHVGIGADSNTYSNLYVYEDYTDPSENKYGMLFIPRLLLTTNNSRTFTGLNSQPTVLDGNAIVAYTGVLTSYYNYIAINNQTQAQTFAEARGIDSAFSIGTNATIVARYGFYVRDATGGGTLTDQYGVYILALTKGSGRNNPIYCAGGDSYHAGNWLLGAAWYGLLEMTAPGNPAANGVYLYAVEGGDTLTDYCARFQDGTIITIAEEATPLDSPILAQPSQTEVKIKQLKPHPGLIDIVAEYPDGKTFSLKRIEYHDAEKIAANKGCDNPLPNNWEVTTLQQRVSKNVAELDIRLNDCSKRIADLDNNFNANAKRIKQLEKQPGLVKELEMLQIRQSMLPSEREGIVAEREDFINKKNLELGRL